MTDNREQERKQAVKDILINQFGSIDWDSTVEEIDSVYTFNRLTPDVAKEKTENYLPQNCKYYHENVCGNRKARGRAVYCNNDLDCKHYEPIPIIPSVFVETPETIDESGGLANPQATEKVKEKIVVLLKQMALQVQRGQSAEIYYYADQIIALLPPSREEKVIGRPISRQESIELSRKILDNAERERLEIATKEAWSFNREELRKSFAKLCANGNRSCSYDCVNCKDLNSLLPEKQSWQEQAKAEAIHNWFELSYASYLVLPRSILQSAPDEWQTKFVALLEVLHGLFGDVPAEGTYHITLKNDAGKFISDPLRDYERGRRHIKPVSVK